MLVVCVQGTLDAGEAELGSASVASSARCTVGNA